MSNASPVSRLRNDIARFRAGALSVEQLQAAVEGHSSALEGMDPDWLRLAQYVEGRLDILRFTASPETMSGEVLREVAALEEYLAARGL